MLCLSYTRNAICLSETCAEATGNNSAELSKERLQLAGHDASLYVYNPFLDNTLCSVEMNIVEGGIAQLACHEAWIATMVTCLTKQEGRAAIN